MATERPSAVTLVPRNRHSFLILKNEQIWVDTYMEAEKLKVSDDRVSALQLGQHCRILAARG